MKDHIETFDTMDSVERQQKYERQRANILAQRQAYLNSREKQLRTLRNDGLNDAERLQKKYQSSIYATGPSPPVREWFQAKSLTKQDRDVLEILGDHVGQRISKVDRDKIDAFADDPSAIFPGASSCGVYNPKTESV